MKFLQDKLDSILMFVFGISLLLTITFLASSCKTTKDGKAFTHLGQEKIVTCIISNLELHCFE